LDVVLVVDGQQPSDSGGDHSGSDGGGYVASVGEFRGGQLQGVLIREGVAQARKGGVSVAKLATLSRGVIPKSNWTRYVTDGDLPRESALPAMAAALEAAGANTTLCELQQALRADKATRRTRIHALRATNLKRGAPCADLMLELIEALPSAEEQETFFANMWEGLTHDQRLAIMRAMASGETKRGGRRGSPSDGSASGANDGSAG
jgi:hypothetical protein